MEEEVNFMDEVTECPYVAGNKIALQLEGRSAQATIAQTFEPWTLSCAMVLSFDSNLSALGIKESTVDPWFPEIERDLFQFLCSDKGMKFAIEHGKCCIKQKEEDYCFMPIIEDDTGEEQEQQSTCEQEDNKSDNNGNDNANSKGTLSRFSMLSMKLLFPLAHAY
ncbi:hypothetical protein N7491_006936 [Penicillium cf. griseofulvum]|nr:hypothetical protein N7491_006936 [Penicillium cf. griseofulvum]